MYEIKNEVEIFLRENKNNIHVEFHNVEFVVMLAYLADVFGHLNDMNLSLQGRDVKVSDVKDKLAGLTARIETGKHESRWVPLSCFLFWKGT